MESHDLEYEAPQVIDLGTLEDLTRTSMGNGLNEMQGGKT